jgi:hypothetical protein
MLTPSMVDRAVHRAFGWALIRAITSDRHVQSVYVELRRRISRVAGRLFEGRKRSSHVMGGGAHAPAWRFRGGPAELTAGVAGANRAYVDVAPITKRDEFRDPRDFPRECCTRPHGARCTARLPDPDAAEQDPPLGVELDVLRAGREGVRRGGVYQGDPDGLLDQSVLDLDPRAVGGRGIGRLEPLRLVDRRIEAPAAVAREVAKPPQLNRGSMKSFALG